jgi:hypothetical protein
VTDAANSEQSSKENNTEIFYGVMIALLVAACVITVIVWVRIIRRNSKLLVYFIVYSRNKQSYQN